MDKDRLDEIVEIMLETVCTARKTIRIAGDDYPAALVKSKDVYKRQIYMIPRERNIWILQQVLL